MAPTGGLMQLISQMMGGQNPYQANIPTSQVSPAPAGAATPSMFPGSSGNPAANAMQANQNPLMTLAQKAIGNPMMQTIPQAPQAPQGGRVLQQVLQSIGPALQNMGYGMMTGGQQQESQSLAAQKADALARLAETGQWHEMTSGIQQQRANTAEEMAKTSEEKAKIAEARVEAYKEIGQQRNEIEKARSEWQKDIASGNLNLGLAKMAQQAKLFDESLNQKKDLFEQDLNLRQQALESQNYFKDAAQEIMRMALAQGGTAKAAEIMQQATSLGVDHYFQAAIGNVPTGPQILQQGAGAGMPGTSPVSAPTTGAVPPMGQPPMPKPTPQAKARAKGSTAKPKVIQYDAQGNRVGG